MTNQDEELLTEALLRWEELQEDGVYSSVAELLPHRPDLTLELQRRIRLLQSAAWLDKPLDDDPPPDDPPGELAATTRTLAGRYRLEELIAEGGFAGVFRAIDTKLERTVAVKLPKASRVESGEAFQAEAKRVASLKHEGIVPVFDAGTDGDTCFIVTEFLEGGSLADRLAKGDVVSRDAIRWIAEIGDALDYAHRHGVVHLDIKPANILLDHRGRAKLADFGIAFSIDHAGHFAPSLGTLRYMSPEQLGGMPADHRSDIYSLAVVLYEILSGRSPYQSSDRQVLRKEILLGQTSSWDSHIPSRLRTAVGKALSIAPDQRQSSAAEFADEIRKAFDRQPPRWNRRWVAGLLTLAGALGSAPLIHRQITAPMQQPPGQVILAGIGSQRILKGSVSPSWIKEGVFAEISGSGVAKFPRLPMSAFVLEIDLEMRNTSGLITFSSGEPGSAVELALGGLWPRDAKQDKVACRLFRIQPWGKNWIGDAYFPPNERLKLNLIVNDEFKAVVRNNGLVLGSSGEPADFCLTVRATEEAEATIHRVICRGITPRDLEEAEQPFSPRSVECDVAVIRKRLATQIEPSWIKSPVIGEPFVINELELPLRWIKAGEYTMGDPTAQLPQFGAGSERVRISHGYWIGAYEVTQGQWDRVMGRNPSRITGSPYLPVNNISWSEAGAFCRKLTERERGAGRCPPGYEYRLPTEAEWEFACRAGGNQPFVIPRNEIAMRDNRFPSIVEVGTTPPNAWGLYEVHGNLSEWCLDAWGDYGDNASAVVVDRYLQGSPETSWFVVRGNGFWITEMAYTLFSRTRRRDLGGGFRGFRVALGVSVDFLMKKGTLPMKEQP